MMRHLQQAFAADIQVRRGVDEKASPRGIEVIARDIGQGTVYAAILEQARRSYQGRVEMGEDPRRYLRRP